MKKVKGGGMSQQHEGIVGGDGSGQCGDVLFMVLDVKAQSNGEMHLWGRSPVHGSVLVRVADYCPYFYIPCPMVWKDKGNVWKDGETKGVV